MERHRLARGGRRGGREAGRRGKRKVRRGRPAQAREDAAARSLDVLRRLLQEGRAAARPADHLPLQRRPGLLDASGCTWARSGRAGWSPPTTSTPRPRPTRWSTTPTACSTLATWCSSMRRAPASRGIAGKDKEKAFWGVDEDAHAFAEFIMAFLSQVRPLELAQIPVRRELRHPALGGAGQRTGDGRVDRLQRRDAAVADPQLRPVSIDGPELNPGDRPALRHRAADLWRRPPGTTTGCPARDRPISSRSCAEVEHFAITDYAARAGAGLRARSRRQATRSPTKLHDYIGLPVDYIARPTCARRRPVRAAAARPTRRRDRPARQPLRRPGDGPARQGDRLRSADRRRSARPTCRRSTTTSAGP